MLKYTELFYSLQGEGLRVGVPSVFLRLFGCNFRCSGFGNWQNLPEDSLPYNYVDIPNQLSELPVYPVGCDSYASWHPRFKSLAKTGTTIELLNEVFQIVPYEKLPMTDFVITGGEPLLKGWQKELPPFLQSLVDMGIQSITFETNGTQVLTPEFSSCLKELCTPIYFSASVKLSNSGETFEDRIIPRALESYQAVGTTFLKFVSDGSQGSIAEIRNLLSSGFGEGLSVYVMPEGATVEQQRIHQARVAEFCLEYHYNFSPRLHCELFGNQWGT